MILPHPQNVVGFTKTIFDYAKLVKGLLVTLNDHLTRVTGLFRGWPTFFSKKVGIDCTKSISIQSPKSKH